MLIVLELAHVRLGGLGRAVPLVELVNGLLWKHTHTHTHTQMDYIAARNTITAAHKA